MYPEILETLRCQTLLTRKSPYFGGISIHHSPLYKHQTTTFLMYAETLQLSHYRVHRDFSFTNLTFEGFLAGTTPLPSVQSFCSCSQILIGATWRLQLTVDFSTSSFAYIYIYIYITHNFGTTFYFLYKFTLKMKFNMWFLVDSSQFNLLDSSTPIIQASWIPDHTLAPSFMFCSFKSSCSFA